MIATKPKVTIIMATYNRAHFIVETLQSIQKQSYTNWECLIIDDEGTDNTQEIITPLLEKDFRFKFLKRLHKYKKGLPGCRNYGLDLADGDYIIFFDDDDIVHPKNLEFCVEVLKDDTIDFVHYQKLAFREETPFFELKKLNIKSKLSIKDIQDIANETIGLASCTVMWKKECFKQVRFNERLLYAEEWECYIRIIAENFSGLVISNILYFNRKHLYSNTGEFYSNNPTRRYSKKEAILLVVKNLKQKQLLTPSLIHHFIQLSLGFKEYKLFDKLVEIMQFSLLEKIKWKTFYFTLPLRLALYSSWKNLK